MTLRALIFLFFFSTLVFSVHGQHLSVGGRFELDKKNGCAPLAINITAPECGSTSCNIDFGDGTGPRAMISSYQFNNPGTYTVRIVFGASGSDLIVVQVLPDAPPAFEISRCAGALNTISVKITDTNYDDYEITYSDGTIVPGLSSGDDDSHSFATPGLKSVSVKGRKSGFEDNCTPSSQSITIAPTLIDGAFTELEVLDEFSLRLGMTLEPFTQYRLEMATNNSTTFQTYGPVYAISDLTINNLQTDNNFYCFRLATFDPCSSSITGYSDVICSADLDVLADDRFNHLDWKTSDVGVSGYSISKSDPTTTFTPLAATPPTLVLDDTDVDCTVTYTYQLTATYANGSTSISRSRQVTSISITPPLAVQNISASVVGQNQVDLVWTQDPAFTASTYEVFRSALGFTTKIGATPTTNFTDNQYNISTTTCYRIRYGDTCGNESVPSIEACPVMLTGYVNSDNSIQLSWTPYLGWTGGVASYTIEKYDTQGELLQTFTPGNTSSFLDATDDPDNQVYTYIVYAIPTDVAVTPASSNAIKIIKEPNVFYPNAFTPNGDELNDTFKLGGQFIVGFELKVFNRWGELVFTSNDVNVGWDGNFRGGLMPEGTYVFVAKIKDMAGRTLERSGAVLLLKKN